MEKKTIGSFIAVLRKSKGMTQRELAERLCVSDKAVSRWERDETAPDLTLIPVIADIFGVTSDEILRGEKKSAEALDGGEEKSRRSEKQIKHLIDSCVSKYKTLSFIIFGIAAVGSVICAAVSLYGRPTLGFCLGLVFTIAALVCTAVFASNAARAGKNDEIDEKTVKLFKLKIYKQTLSNALFVVFCLCLDVFVLIYMTSLLSYAFLALLAYVIIHVTSAFTFSRRFSKELDIPESERKNLTLAFKTLCTVLAVAFLLVGGLLASFKLPLEFFGKGVSLKSVFEFNEFMRNYKYEDELWILSDGSDRNIPKGYSDEYKTKGVEDFPCVRFLEITTDENGDVISKHYENDYVLSIKNVPLEGESPVLPIVCYTVENAEERAKVLDTLTGVVIVLCVLDAGAGLAFCFLKRKRD